MSNAVGPFTAILSVYQNHTVPEKVDTPFWVLVAGGGKLRTVLPFPLFMASSPLLRRYALFLLIHSFSCGLFPPLSIKRLTVIVSRNCSGTFNAGVPRAVHHGREDH